MTTPAAPIAGLQAAPVAPSAQRTLHVRCTTWDQVHVFTTRKLRRGKLLSMKVPFSADPGAGVTLGLELPNGLVIAIDGSVLRASPVEGDREKTWIEVELVGFTDEVFARLREMATGAMPPVAPEGAEPAPAPTPPRTITPGPGAEGTADERELFQHLTAELRRMRALPVHDVLGVARDAAPAELRRGWMEHVNRHHPDLFARRNSPALSHLAEELTILCNRAYDRMRAAAVAEGRGTAFGPAIAAPAGWLVGFDDLASDGATPTAARPQRTSQAIPVIAPAQVSSPAPAGSGANVQGGEAFELRARTMLGDGDPETAREVLAAALCVYPKSKPLRSLYYVASALGALQAGEVMLATSQLETALAHHEQCTEAAAMLEHVRKHGPDEIEALKDIFK